jgi:hypothetical protein
VRLDVGVLGAEQLQASSAAMRLDLSTLSQPA